MDPIGIGLVCLLFFGVVDVVAMDELCCLCSESHHPNAWLLLITRRALDTESTTSNRDVDPHYMDDVQTR